MNFHLERLERIARHVKTDSVEGIPPHDLALLHQAMELFDWSASEVMWMVDKRIAEINLTSEEQS